MSFLADTNYKYEEHYQYHIADNIYAQYKPDFYLPDNNIYIEHQDPLEHQSPGKYRIISRNQQGRS